VTTFVALILYSASTWRLRQLNRLMNPPKKQKKRCGGPGGTRKNCRVSVGVWVWVCRGRGGFGGGFTGAKRQRACGRDK
jgi:hypothetical protein